MNYKLYQVTLFCTTGQYRPVSTIVRYRQEANDNLLFDAQKRSEIITLGVQKLCLKHYWGKKDLIRYGYTHAKAREYTRVNEK